MSGRPVKTPVQPGRAVGAAAALLCLAGGPGRDQFAFGAGDSTPGDADLITNLQADDLIDLTALSTAAGAPIHLVAAFGGAAGEMTLSYDKASDLTLLAVDLEGDGQADFVLKLTGDQQDFSDFTV